MAKIWKSRVDRELNALGVSTSAPIGALGSKISTAEGVLPPFLTVYSTDFDFGKGIAKIVFEVELSSSESTKVILDDNDDAKKPAENVGGDRVLLNVDISMTNSDDSGSRDSTEPYTFFPFQPPVMTLQPFAPSSFPPSSNIAPNVTIPLLLDWTPSLHVSDAALDVGVRLRECRRSGERIEGIEGVRDVENEDYRITESSGRNSTLGLLSGLSKNENKGKQGKLERYTLETVFTVGSEVDLVIFDEVYKCRTSCQCVRTPDFIQLRHSSVNGKNRSTPAGIDEEESDPSVGLESCGGAPALTSGSVKSVAKTGASGVGSFFSNLSTRITSAAQKTQILHENFLAITGKQIVEIRCGKFRMERGEVVKAESIDGIGKLKFRRGESVSFYFKANADDPLIYLSQDSSLIVQTVQNEMNRKGLKGKHTTPHQTRLIADAVDLVTLIQIKERHLETDGAKLGRGACVDIVREVMDLYRQAAEKFSLAGDSRYQDVMEHMSKFLRQDRVAKILEEGDEVRKMAVAGNKGDFFEDGEEDDDECDGDGDNDEDTVETPLSPSPQAMPSPQLSPNTPVTPITPTILATPTTTTKTKETAPTPLGKIIPALDRSFEIEDPISTADERRRSSITSMLQIVEDIKEEIKTDQNNLSIIENEGSEIFVGDIDGSVDGGDGRNDMGGGRGGGVDVMDELDAMLAQATNELSEITDE